MLTSLFLLGGIVLLTVRPSGVTLRVGELATRDYRARVDFSVPDEAATRRARERAQEECPRVFREKRGDIEKLCDELPAFLDQALNARSLKDLGPRAAETWGLTEDRFRALMEGLNREWIDSAVPAISAAVSQTAEPGILDGTLLQQERAAARVEIVVRDDQASPPRESRRNIGAIVEYPAGLQKALADKLMPVLSDRSPAFQDALIGMIVHRATPTLRLDPVATRQALLQARDRVAPVARTIARESIILAADDRVTQAAIEDLKAEEAEYARTRGAGDAAVRPHFWGRPFLSGLGVTSLFLLAFFLLASCGRHATTDIFASNTRVAMFYAIGLLTFAAVRLLDAYGLSLQWAPVVLAAMVFAVTVGPFMAFGAVVMLSGMAGIATHGGLNLAVPLLLGGSVAILRLARLRRRTDVFETGLLAGLAQSGAVWAMWAAGLLHAQAESPIPPAPVLESLAALGSGVLAGGILTAALPYVERAFDVATDLRLLEWTDQNQPLLRKLAMDAPGTYHHSTVVSNMAEVAAEAIGANALLARAGGYLHDVGKINRAEYFVENTTGQPSLHERLTPMLSALILTAHTKDGAELAAQYGVPSPIRRIIAEHHGTSVVEFFYQKAVKESKSGDGQVSVDAFRYRNPKPRSPEAAIVMLADSAESAARSLERASPNRIEQLVREIVQRRLEDGQLDDCRMNVTDIRAVERSLVRSLTAISHPRIHYPKA